MIDRALPVESEPIRAVNPLRMARWFALICVLIGAGGLFHEATRPAATFWVTDWSPYFASFACYVAVLCLLFLRGKKPLAFALGTATATGLLGGALGVLGLWVWIYVVLTNFSPWLLWLFFLCSMLLGLSAYWAFDKLRTKGERTPWLPFAGGVFASLIFLAASFAIEVFEAIRALR
jgi:hypothetical protein